MLIANQLILKKLFVSSWLIYFFSYIGRLNYTASMLAIGEEKGFSISELGLVITALFISYGTGQLFSGVLGDLFSPIKLIVFGLCLCSFCNLIMPLSQTIHHFICVWFVNGFALSLIWPPMLKILSRHMPSEVLRKSCFHIQTSVALGTFFTYVFCGILIAFSSWEWIFYSSSVFLGVATLIASVIYPSIEKYALNTPSTEPTISNTLPVTFSETTNSLKLKVLFSSGFIVILGIIFIMGFLKDGIMTWIPQYLTDTFDLLGYFSIFISAILPLINILGVYSAQLIYKKTHCNDLLTTLILYCISTFSLLGLIVWGDYHIVLSILMLSIVTSSMLGINTILVSILPTYFERYGKISTIAGITNSVTYLGSALCGYGLGSLVESFGWSMTRMILVCISCVAIFLCLIAFTHWQRFKTT